MVMIHTLDDYKAFRDYFKQAAKDYQASRPDDPNFTFQSAEHQLIIGTYELNVGGNEWEDIPPFVLNGKEYPVTNWHMMHFENPTMTVFFTQMGWDGDEYFLYIEGHADSWSNEITGDEIRIGKMTEKQRVVTVNYYEMTDIA
jgi:hypothetical protein